MNMRKFLHGMANNIPDIVNLYMYSQQYNLQKAQEERLAKESEQRMDIAQKKEIREEAKSKANIKQAESWSTFYDVLGKEHQLNTEQLEKGIENGAKVEESRDRILKLLSTYQDNPDMAYADREQIVQSLQSEKEILQTLTGELDFIDSYRKKSMSLEATSSLTMLSLYASEKTVMGIVDKMDTEGITYQEGMKQLLADPQWRREYKESLSRVSEMHTTIDKAIGDYIYTLKKDAGLDKLPKRVRVIPDEKGISVTTSLNDEDWAAVQFDYDRQIVNLLDSIVRTGLPPTEGFTGMPPAELYTEIFEMYWLKHYPMSFQQQYWQNDPRKGQQQITPTTPEQTLTGELWDIYKTQPPAKRLIGR